MQQQTTQNSFPFEELYQRLGIDTKEIEPVKNPHQYAERFKKCAVLRADQISYTCSTSLEVKYS